MHQFLRSVDRIVATSPDYLETSPRLEHHREKCDVIPIGLDQQSYPSSSPSRLAAWRERFGTQFFLFVGVLRYYKGLHNLLEAAAGTRYPVVIVGDGPLGAELREEARRLGLTNVHFLGALSDEDKIALLTLCRAFIFPSHLRAEAFGISLLEAAMHGKPLISCEIGTGTSYINQHGQTGLVVAPDDPVALRRAMKTLWDDAALCAAFGAQAAARYAALFTANQMAVRYLQVYQSLAAAPSARR
jgi:rhamnosyl/mannosyltransferase